MRTCLDFNASTPVDPVVVVVAAMRPYLEDALGNPPSGHWASMPPAVGMGAIRFSLGRSTTDEGVDAVVSALAKSHSPTRGATSS